MSRHTASQPGPAKPATTRRRAGRGQSLVEFALITPVLILILAISADFGRAFTAYISIGSAAREGASYGMESQANSTDSGGIRDAALDDVPAVYGVTPQVSSGIGTDANGYRYVEVTVRYSFSPIMRIPPIPDSLNMQRSVRMRVIQ
jgi:Flp pilus assembly protein TadG